MGRQSSWNWTVAARKHDSSDSSTAPRVAFEPRRRGGRAGGRAGGGQAAARRLEGQPHNGKYACTAHRMPAASAARAAPPDHRRHLLARQSGGGSGGRAGTVEEPGTLPAAELTGWVPHEAAAISCGMAPTAECGHLLHLRSLGLHPNVNQERTFRRF